MPEKPTRNSWATLRSIGMRLARSVTLLGTSGPLLCEGGAGTTRARKERCPGGPALAIAAGC